MTYPFGVGRCGHCRLFNINFMHTSRYILEVVKIYFDAGDGENMPAEAGVILMVFFSAGSLLEIAAYLLRYTTVIGMLRIAVSVRFHQIINALRGHLWQT